jgi:hypothetical protein
MGLVLPVVFAILFASYELARANLLRHVARASAYEGARVGILPGASAADIRAVVNRSLGTVGVRGADVTITPESIQARSPKVRVDVSIDAAPNFLTAPFFFRGAAFSGDCELSREVL